MKRLHASLLVLILLAGTLLRGSDSIALSWVHGVDTDLPMLPKKLFTNTLIYEDAYLYTLSYVHNFTAYPVGYAQLHIGFEGVLGKHYGIQKHVETAAAVQLKLSSLLPPQSPVNVDYAIGEGVSYAFGEPNYEDTPVNEPDRHYRFQNFISMDFDFYLRDYPTWQFMLRLHHRSGIYGIVAPPKVGSNFIGYGVKYLF